LINERNGKLHKLSNFNEIFIEETVTKSEKYNIENATNINHISFIKNRRVFFILKN